MDRRPLIIGVAGGSGSGKTTVARAIGEAAGTRAVLIEQDAYYQDQAHMPMAVRMQTNYDHPDAFDTELMVRQLEAIASGRPIDKPTYDYPNHTRAAETIRVEPADVVVVEGILLFVDARLRALFDIKVFVDVPDDVRFIRRLRRDTVERGRSMDGVIRQYLETVRPMHLEFVEPSKRWADVIIPEGGRNTIGIEMILARVEREMRARTGAGPGGSPAPAAPPGR